MQMKWVKCEVKLPENEEECLVAARIVPTRQSAGMTFDLATYVNGVFLSWELEKVVERVTHWMKLPQDPED